MTLSLRSRALLQLLGAVLLALSALNTLQGSEPFLRSYLFSYLFWIDLPLGALPLLMIFRLTGGRWGDATAKALEAMTGTLYLFAILALPILFWMGRIYPWLDPSIASDPRIAHKHLYLNPASFVVRAIFYFACWAVLASRTKRPSSGPDHSRGWSAGGLVLFGLTSTFAGIDWQMSVEPKWYSTMYGVVYAVGQALQAFAFALVAYGLSAKNDRSRRKPETAVFWDMGNILMTLVILWTYVSFMQYLIIWSGNLPHEVTWFIHRTTGGWQWLVLILALFQFTAPFTLLLFRRAKDSTQNLMFLGLLVFVVRVIDHYWMLMPGFFPERITLPWQAVTLWLAMGAIWISLFARSTHAVEVRTRG